MLKFLGAPLKEGSGEADFTSALIVPPTSEPALSIWLTSWPVTDGLLLTFVSTFAVVTGAFATETVPPSSDSSTVTFAADVWTAAAFDLSGTVIVTSTFVPKRLPAPNRLAPLWVAWI